MAGPLSHIRVLDMTRVLAGPWTGQNLSDLGAEVIEVERPGKGDDSRAFAPPYIRDRDGKETRESAYFCCANRGKKSVTVDISRADGAKLIALQKPEKAGNAENTVSATMITGTSASSVVKVRLPATCSKRSSRRRTRSHCRKSEMVCRCWRMPMGGVGGKSTHNSAACRTNFSLHCTAQSGAGRTSRCAASLSAPGLCDSVKRKHSVNRSPSTTFAAVRTA